MSILIFLFILLGLVVVHEFGHFIVAKLFKIRVDEFAFGFPPKLFGKKIGETEYRFNLLPIGGYVKIFGEDPLEVEETHPDRERSFFRKPRYVQAAVIVAGVFFNLIAAFLLFFFLFFFGAQTSKSFVPLDIPLTNEELRVISVLPESPSYKAGIAVGSTVLSISSKGHTTTPKSSEEFSEFVAKHQENPVIVSLRGIDASVKEVTLIPQAGFSPDKKIIGLSTDSIGTLKLPFFSSIARAFEATVTYTKQTIVGFSMFIGGLFTKEASLNDLTGPVGIVGIVDEARSVGIVALLTFTALISINLAVLNLIPFPALDGGRLFFVIIESIIRRPLPLKFQTWTNAIGFALLILLMVVVTYQDIVKLG